VTMFPCNECAKLLIQAGIREVVYNEVGVRFSEVLVVTDIVLMLNILQLCEIWITLCPECDSAQPWCTHMT